MRIRALGGFKIAALLSALLLGAANAGAQSTDGADAAFAEGRFLDAAALFEKRGTSAGYAMATQSLATQGFYLAAEDEKIPLFERAMALAAESVRLDPDNPEAHYQSAHALGRYAQQIGKMRALRQGLAGKLRDFLETALGLDPDLVSARVSLAGWHADIVASAGRLVARTLYGATRKDAVAHYERALELTPDSKVALLEYGRRLTVLDRKAGRERAREMLARASEVPVDDASERLIQKEVVAELAALDSN